MGFEYGQMKIHLNALVHIFTHILRICPDAGIVT